LLSSIAISCSRLLRRLSSVIYESFHESPERIRVEASEESKEKSENFEVGYNTSTPFQAILPTSSVYILRAQVPFPAQNPATLGRFRRILASSTLTSFPSIISATTHQTNLYTNSKVSLGSQMYTGTLIKSAELVSGEYEDRFLFARFSLVSL